MFGSRLACDGKSSRDLDRSARKPAGVQVDMHSQCVGNVQSKKRLPLTEVAGFTNVNRVPRCLGHLSIKRPRQRCLAFVFQSFCLPL